jgi:3-phytase
VGKERSARSVFGPVVLAGVLALVAFQVSCGHTRPPTTPAESQEPAIQPVVVTEQVTRDSDDPAIWLHPENPAESLILGTDKAGLIYVFDLDGSILPDKTVSGMARMNNVDVEYGMILGGMATDIAAATDRDSNLLRVFRLPDMKAIDHGGIEMFEGEDPAHRRPMGVALYRRHADGTIFAIVSRKEGPSGSYLWQYRLEDDGTGNVAVTKVREFGEFSNDGEIEAVVVDDPLGFVYYSDERAGIRKYHADPEAPNANLELALFGTTGFTDDREGISIYRVEDGTGYILVSDQQANRFQIFKRQGEPGDTHHHRLVKVVNVSTSDSDGSEVTNAALNDSFPAGLFVAMSDDKTFHFYSWTDIAGDDLVIAPDGKSSAR